jgi:hypothetical protein
MLASKLPFRLESLEQVAQDIIHCRLVPLRERCPDLPQWILEVQARAHHPVLEQRYRTATAFLQALDERNAHPEGDEEADARTVPFQRVDLHTPPPELMSRLKGKGAGTAEPDGRDAHPRDRELGRVLRISPTGGGREREVAQIGRAVGPLVKDPTGPTSLPVKSSASRPEQSGSIGEGGEGGRRESTGPNAPGSPWEGNPTRPARPERGATSPRREAALEPRLAGTRSEEEEQLTIPVEKLSMAELQQSGNIPLPARAISSAAGPTTALTRGGRFPRWLLIALVGLLLLGLGVLVYLIASG